jgi:hypothetical protein
MNSALVADVLTTWIAALAAGGYLWFLQRMAEQSSLGRRQRFLLLMLTVLLFLRGFAWLVPGTVLVRLTFVAAVMLPLALALFAEALMRRHLPPLAKWFIALGTGLFLLSTLSGELHRQPWMLPTFLSFELLVLAGLGLFLLQRDRASLSTEENVQIRAVLVAAVLAIPLIATDFRTLLGVPPVRLGSLAALLLIYVSLRYSPDPRHYRALSLELLLMLALAMLLGAVFWFAGGLHTPAQALTTLVLALAAVLALAIFGRLLSLRRTQDETGLQGWLAKLDCRDLNGLMLAIPQLPATREAVLLQAEQLQHHDIDALQQLFAQEFGPLHLERLQRLASGDEEATREAAGQLLDILERNDCNHLCVLSCQPVRLLLCHFSNPVTLAQRRTELSILQTLARSIEYREGARDPAS